MSSIKTLAVLEIKGADFEKEGGNKTMLKKRKHVQETARKLITEMKSNSMVVEQYRTLRTNINFLSPDSMIRSIVIASAASAEGKSTTAANLAIVFAQEGKKTLLVDGDLRKPTMQYTFHTENTRGLSSILTHQSTIREAIKMTSIENLNLLTSGPLPPNPTELLASESFEQLLEQLQASYEIILFDSPPLLSVADGKILANKCDGTLLLINSGSTEKYQAIKAKEAVIHSKSRLLGAVLNNYDLPPANYYDQYLSSV